MISCCGCAATAFVQKLFCTKNIFCGYADSPNKNKNASWYLYFQKIIKKIDFIKLFMAT
jgi:hypothetical protein